MGEDVPWPRFGKKISFGHSKKMEKHGLVLSLCKQFSGQMKFGPPSWNSKIRHCTDHWNVHSLLGTTAIPDMILKRFVWYHTTEAPSWHSILINTPTLFDILDVIDGLVQVGRLCVLTRSMQSFPSSDVLTGGHAPYATRHPYELRTILSKISNPQYFTLTTISKPGRQARNFRTGGGRVIR